MNQVKPEIILVGGGGHCKAAIDIIEQEGKYTIKGVLDPKRTEPKILGYPVLGGDDLIASLANSNTYFLITVGQIKSCSLRQKLAALLSEHNALLATVVSPLAYVSKHAEVAKGTIIMHKAVVNASAKVGEHCIINTMANIEHDAVIEDFCHISTSATVNGASKVQAGSFIGSHAVLSNNITVSAGSVISAGEFVKS